MLKVGYTSVAEFHYVHHDIDGTPYADPAELALRISHAASAAGIGLTLLPVLYSHSGFGGQAPNDGQRRFINSTENYLKLQSRLQPVLAGQPSQALGLCFHSLRAVTPGQIQDVLAASDRECPVHIHIAEQQKEVDDCLSWSGARPLQWLYEKHRSRPALVPGPRHPRQCPGSQPHGQEPGDCRPVPDHRSQPGGRDFSRPWISSPRAGAWGSALTAMYR
nr:hypothetical protein GCM10020185_27110 [Pseudomonas brassicacearum subsp. brassicacearum]